eukprot:1160994-Pelagomonas_calceolata.AAC.2
MPCSHYQPLRHDHLGAAILECEDLHTMDRYCVFCMWCAKGRLPVGTGTKAFYTWCAVCYGLLNTFVGALSGHVMPNMLALWELCLAMFMQRVTIPYPALIAPHQDCIAQACILFMPPCTGGEGVCVGGCPAGTSGVCVFVCARACVCVITSHWQLTTLEGARCCKRGQLNSLLVNAVVQTVKCHPRALR